MLIFPCGLESFSQNKNTQNEIKEKINYPAKNMVSL